MDGSDDGTNEQKLHGLVQQVEQDHGDEGAGSMAEDLRDRMEETKTEPEDGGDRED
ncbi:hypothetical protein C8E83_1927 [Frondihabitans australicus]|uniref:Uncharacterized protein n=2 Tax=Frondihabitans australicus TaxID=386892 RepID=A0A495IFL5_9MICO|nr:hypothetical protein C8E83_1927 [Frondihabitans australicus]